MMVTLHLPLSAVNVVLQGLGELPLKVSRRVSEGIEQQAQTDIQRQQEFMRRSSQPAEQTPAPTEPVQMPSQAAEAQ